MGISCFSLYAPAVEMFNACSYMHIYICILNCVFYTSSKLVYDVHVKKNVTHELNNTHER